VIVPVDFSWKGTAPFNFWRWAGWTTPCCSCNAARWVVQWQCSRGTFWV